jgi:hypothetical protein
MCVNKAGEELNVFSLKCGPENIENKIGVTFQVI